MHSLLRAASVAVLASGIACSNAPTAATPVEAPTAPAPAHHALFETSASVPLGALVLSGSADTMPAGSSTTIQVTYSDQVASAFWEFGDGQTSHLFRTTIQHVYQASGRYHAFLTVTSFAGASERVDGFIDVLPPEPDRVPPPAPRPPPNDPVGWNLTLTAAPATLPIGGSTLLTATTTRRQDAAPASPARYAWSCGLGDGVGVEGGPSVTCTYATAGTSYPVVNASGGNYAVGGNTQVRVLAPVFAASCTSPGSVGTPITCSVTATLDGAPIAVASSNWQWGDGTADDLNVVGGTKAHTYGAAGTYHVTLRAAVSGSPTLHTITGDVVVN